MPVESRAGEGATEQTADEAGQQGDGDGDTDEGAPPRAAAATWGSEPDAVSGG